MSFLINQPRMGIHNLHICFDYLWGQFLIFHFVTVLKFNLFADLEWKIIYVGSAESEAHDQVLDSVFVGPVPEGRHMFVFQVFIF